MAKEPPKPSKTPEQQAAEDAKLVNSAPSNIPRVEEGTGANVGTGIGGSPSPDLEDYEGKYLRKSDGNLYALAIEPDDRIGRTHKATNTQFFWEGNEAQFKEAFTMEDGSEIKEIKVSTKKAAAAKSK